MPIDESAGAGAVTIPPVPAIGLVFGSRRTLEEDIREDMRLFRTRMVGPKPARSKSQTDNPPPHHVSLNSDDMVHWFWHEAFDRNIKNYSFDFILSVARVARPFRNDLPSGRQGPHSDRKFSARKFGTAQS